MSDESENLAEELAGFVPYCFTPQFQRDIQFIKTQLIGLGKQMTDTQSDLDAGLSSVEAATTALETDVASLQATDTALLAAVKQALASLPSTDFTPEVTRLNALVTSLSGADSTVQAVTTGDAAETTAITPPEPPAST